MKEQSGNQKPTRKPSKGSRNRKKSEENAESAFGIHNVPKDLVDIERNIVEKWLLSLKHWAKFNQNIAKYIIIGVAVLFVLTLSIIFIVSVSYDSHNSRFYTLLEQYESNRKSLDANKDEQLHSIAAGTDQLCNRFFSTKYSNTGCLLSALIYLELKDSKNAASSLERYSQHVSSDGLSAFTLFFSAYYNESENPDKSLQQYETLKNRLKAVEKEDIALFHLARIYYYKNEFEKSENMLTHLLDNYTSSSYRDAAKKYLLLISLKKNLPPKSK